MEVGGNRIGMNCPQCGESVLPGAQYCDCGAAIQADAPPIRSSPIPPPHDEPPKKSGGSFFGYLLKTVGIGLGTMDLVTTNGTWFRYGE
ncbi:MAG TPA: hypothetical protein VGO93_27860, partial [Candidatus Xenobia bacterium]